MVSSTFALPRRIVFIAGRDPYAELAGDSTYARAHARAAIQLGFAPHIFSVSRQGEVVETDIGVLHRTASPFRPFRIVMLPMHAPLVARAVYRFLLARPGPHLIHSIGPWSYIGVSVSERLQRAGTEAVPVVSAFGTYEYESYGRLRGLSPLHSHHQRLRFRIEHLWNKVVVRRCERRGYSGSRLVIVNYESVRRLLVAGYVSGTKIRKLPYTSESAFQQEKPTPVDELPKSLTSLRSGGAPLVVAVSRHDPRKGLDTLLRAFAELRAAGVPFRGCLVGGGMLLADHRRLAQKLRLGDAVAIEGEVADSQVYLRHADVFVLPSLEEGSGSLSLIEALQAGVAVVASNIDGIPEDVVDGDSAVLVEPGNVFALRDAIRGMVTDSGLRQRLARRSRETFEERFSADGFTEALGAIYAELGFMEAPHHQRAKSAIQ